MDNQRYQEIADLFAEEFGTISSQMFGKPCLKINNKAFVAFFMGEMVFKLGRLAIEQVRESYPGSVNFDPSGKNRPMKDWLQVPVEFEEDWVNLARQSLEFVQEHL